MLPVMVEKLATGRPIVQNHYRGELASSGDRVVVLIEDLIQRFGSTQNGTLVIGNALGVLGLSDAPSAARVVRRMLGHPAESVRTAAIRAMAKLAEPEDYEVLQGLMPIVNGEIRRVLVQGLGRSDPHRLAADLSEWLAEDGEVALLVLAARSVAESGAGAMLDPGCLELDASLHPNLRPFLVASRAAAGDPEALVLLDLLLVDQSELVRTRSLEAARMAGLERALLVMSTDDDSEILRVLAVESVAGLFPDEAALKRVRSGTRDTSPKVRQASLRALLSHGDEAVRGVFLQMLRSGPSELGPALRAVRGVWEQQPGLAEATSKELITLLDGMANRPLKEREPWIQALGQVPSGEASAWLLDLAQTAQGERHNMSAHRWLVLQVSNGGVAGRELLMQSWAEEADPERRLDYLWGASLSRESDTVEFLLGVVVRDDAPDHERLFAANRLVRSGDTPRVAPTLKRACLGVTDPVVRPAFVELLWLWYS
jgi:HEAT repeat protein